MACMHKFATRKMEPNLRWHSFLDIVYAFEYLPLPFLYNSYLMSHSPLKRIYRRCKEKERDHWGLASGSLERLAETDVRSGRK